MPQSTTATYLAFGFLVAASAADAQLTTLTVGPDLRVSRELPMRNFGEVAACAHPTNRRRMLAVAMYDTAANGSQLQPVVVFQSDNGGMSWKPRLDTGKEGHGTPDPSCALTSTGRTYLATMTIARQRGPIALYMSRDFGATWSNPTMIGTSGFDRPWIAASDPVGGRAARVFLSAFYEARAPFVRDLATFSIRDTTPMRIAGALQRSHYFHNGPLVVVADDLVVGVVAHPTTRAQEPPSLAEPAGGWPSTPVVSALRWDGDTSIAPPVVISRLSSETSPKRFLLTDFIPSVAVDRHSSAFRDRLYTVWLDAATGALRVMLSYSADSGTTWSRPRVVSDDGFGSTGDHPLDSVNPSVAVNDSGVVAVLWYDRRDNADFGYWPRLAASLDGGETWTASVRVARRPMRARLDGLHTLIGPRRVNDETNQELAFEIHNGWNFRPGDTSALIADASGVFHAFWIDNRTGVPQVWTAPVTTTGTARRVKDITDSTTIRLTNLRYDSLARRITVTATVSTPSSMAGPIVLQATTLSSRITDHVEAGDTSNGIRGAGATWILFDSGIAADGGRLHTTTLHFSLGSWKRAALNPLVLTTKVWAPDDNPPRTPRPPMRSHLSNLHAKTD